MCFAVFGVTKEMAETQARKKLKAIEKEGMDGAKTIVKSWRFDRKLSKVDIAIKILSSIGEIPDEAYKNAYIELVSHYMSTLSPKQISSIFGDPKRCGEFIELAKRYEVRKIISKQCIRQPDPKKPGRYQSKWQNVPERMTH